MGSSGKYAIWLGVILQYILGILPDFVKSRRKLMVT